MRYEVVWNDEALAAAASYLSDDPSGLAAVFDATDQLATDPRPAAAVRWGGGEFLRLRVGHYRVRYRIRELVATIDVVHLGRIG